MSRVKARSYAPSTQLSRTFPSTLADVPRALLRPSIGRLVESPSALPASRSDSESSMLPQIDGVEWPALSLLSLHGSETGSTSVYHQSLACFNGHDLDVYCDSSAVRSRRQTLERGWRFARAGPVT